MPCRTLNSVFPLSGRFARCVSLASALLLPAAFALAQTVEKPGAATPSSDAEQRLNWLNSRMPPRPPAEVRPVESKPAEAPATAAPKVGFRSSPQKISAREAELTPAPPERAAPPPSSERRTAEARPSETPAVKAPLKEVATARAGDSRTAKGGPKPTARSTPVAVAQASSTPVVKSTPDAVAKASPSPAAKSTPAPIAKRSATPPPKPAAKAAPSLAVRLDTPAILVETAPTKLTSTGARARAAARTMSPAVGAIPADRPSFSSTSIPSVVKGRNPWKTGIVTTVFWIGEPPSGNNFTPNHSSSWDVNWAVNYGGFDDPNPAARRNFIPAKFSPRLNPFYVALPYNDVTRGTTKPESKLVIPWFKEAFEREGQSVCRDRWLAIRNRAGQVAYAQWSDCGPFRTDHWQYVFGQERPKPNLNQGAGLDVSPAIRDFLGLDGHDVTDWKFVDFKDVPHGPWSRHGENNTFVLEGSRAPKRASRENRPGAQRIGGL